MGFGELSTDAVVCLGLGALVLALVLLRTERNRRATSDRFASLIAELSDAIVVRDATGRILWGSPSTQRVFGYEAHDMLGTSIIDLVHPDDLELAVRQAAEASAVDGSLAPYRVRARHRDGQYRTVDVVATNLLHDPHGRGVVLNITDVTARVAGEAALAAERQHLEAVLDTTTSIIMSVAPDGTVLEVNRAGVELSGFTAEEVIGRPAFDLVAPEDRRDPAEVIGAIRPGDDPGVRVNHWITRSGERRRIRWTYDALFDDAGTVAEIIATGVDVTDEHRAHVERRRAEQRFRVAFDHSPSGLALLDADGVVLEANAVLAGFVGRSADELVGRWATELFELPVGQDLGADTTWHQSIPDRRRGDDRIVLHRVTAIGVDGIDGGGVLLESTDVTGEVRERHELEWQATHDALTGLANRAALLDRLGRELSSPEVESGNPDRLAVLLIDLDGFKAVNDTLGHHVGDAVLVEVAARLGALAREDDLAVRLGGDEFVVVASVPDDDGATAMAARVEAALSEPLSVDGVDVTVGASVGVRMVGPTDSPEAVLVDADLAMYRAKRERRAAAAGAGGTGAVPAEIPANEAERLAALHALQLVDTEGDPTVQAITRLAAQICGTPMAAVTLIDASRQWLLAKVGLDDDETSRDDAFCAHTILDPAVMVVTDADRDDRFATNPLVLGDPFVRFYAGAPLEVAPGTSIGALCVLDDVPRDLTPDQLAALDDLSKLLVDHLSRTPSVR